MNLHNKQTIAIINNRFALSAIRGEFLERDSFGILYTGYLLSIVKIMREIDSEREREQQIINKI